MRRVFAFTGSIKLPSRVDQSMGTVESIELQLLDPLTLTRSSQVSAAVLVGVRPEVAERPLQLR